MRRPLRLATFAVPLSGNKGSASMLLGLRDAFAKAGIDARFAVFSYYPERDGNVAGELENVTVHPGHPRDIFFKLLPGLLLSTFVRRFVPAVWRGHIQVLRDSDAVLLVGGTTFCDTMLFKVPWNVLAALPAYWLHRPTVFLSQTVGPCRNMLNRLAARWALARALEVHARGRQSAEWCQSVGVSRHCYSPDLSFSLAIPEIGDLEKKVRVLSELRDQREKTGMRAIGVAPNSIVYSEAGKRATDYIMFLVSVVKSIHEENFLPVLIPHSYRQDVDNLHNNDRAVCQQVLQRLGDRVPCFYVDADLNSAELRALIGQLDLLVASRFHSMISALAMGVPPITYGWGEHKCSEVLKEFRVQELYVPVDEMDPESFPSQLHEIIEKREELSLSIKQALIEVRREADQIPAKLLRLVTGTGGRGSKESQVNRPANLLPKPASLGLRPASTI